MPFFKNSYIFTAAKNGIFKYRYKVVFLLQNLLESLRKRANENVFDILLRFSIDHMCEIFQQNIKNNTPLGF